MFQDINTDSLGYLFLAAALVCLIVGGIAGLFWNVDKPKQANKKI